MYKEKQARQSVQDIFLVQELNFTVVLTMHFNSKGHQ